MTSQDRILRSAISLFGEQGYEATSLKDIGAHAGHAAGLITHHFKTKAQLFLTCGLMVLDELNEELRQGIRDADDGLHAVLAFAESFLDFAVQKRSAYLVLAKLSPFAVSRPELTSEELVWKIRAMIKQLTDALERGLLDGSVTPLRLNGKTADAELYSLTVFSTIMGTARTLIISPFAQEQQRDATLAFLRNSLRPSRQEKPSGSP